MSDRLRVAFVVESGTDVRLVEGLADRYDLAVFARRIPGAVEVSWPSRKPFPIELGPSSRLSFSRSIRGWMDLFRPHFVIAQGYGLAALAVSRSKVPHALLVCSPVEEYYECRRAADDPAKPYRRREILALRAVARWNAARGSDYIVLSEHLRSVVQSHGARRTNVVPVYGVDLNVFLPRSEARDALRRRLELREGALLFFSSRIAPEKDATTLLLALKALRNQGRTVRILHRSGGWREFVAEAERIGVSDLVVATDAIPPFEKLADDYAACDLTVQASRAEGLGFSVLESLACGTPVVAANVGGLQETVVDGETGWSYRPGDAGDLARAIREALDDPSEAARRTSRGRKMVEARYERDLVFSQLDLVIRTVMEKRR